MPKNLFCFVYFCSSRRPSIYSVQPARCTRRQSPHCIWPRLLSVSTSSRRRLPKSHWLAVPLPHPFPTVRKCSKLGQTGYTTAAKGGNGFRLPGRAVVGQSPLDDSEFWNPKIMAPHWPGTRQPRGAICPIFR